MALTSSALAADSASNRYRSARFRMFLDIVDRTLAEKDRCTILDVGGTAAYWTVFGGAMDWSRVKITLLNLEYAPRDGADHIAQVVGDATDMHGYADNSFDIVHSNSVIEHVGLWVAMEAMAKEVRRLAPQYFVQTPSFWFPIEAHARAPFFQLLPEPLRVWIIMRRKLGYWEMAGDVGEATRTAQSAILLNKRQMRYLFPDAEVITEKAYGFTKSYIAIRRQTVQ
ncbi:class I SAM-dependent methyltransferase [Mesorhizobium sp. BR1-1-16]|uniref:class I SAM-dependent methyltransferase n=1 Tax=Mesorhizobium sp. BR1-1-16 TaxID=2876653 RepID=UPI001CCFB737|nr:class I SAM-dependent methyltransferase [Mesorhizobium sp. BR1-1-16]MBZ9937299.1 class I SAM-dependent methyltransferase [Mesorhizobium sp. BR1-1-16]